MDTARKITMEVPLELLEKAQRASGTGVTQTVRKGYSWLRTRGFTRACGSCEARFASRARRQS